MQFTSLLIALYARLSKDRSGLSENVQIQLREGEEYVDDNDGTVSLRFNDDDISASKFSTKPRPDYDRLIAAIERGEIEVIVVTEMSRLYRRIEELIDLIKMAEHTKLRGIWTTDGTGYDLGTPEGIHAAIAAVNNAMLESAKLSKRGKRKKKARAEAGRYLGGTRAYGYEGSLKDKNGNILNRGRINVALIDHEAEVIKTCVARVIAGDRETTLVNALNDRGIPAPQGGQWCYGNIRGILTKKRYVIFDDNDPQQRGTATYNGQEFQAVWPGLITREQHALMTARFAEVAAEHRSYRRVHRRSYLLTGTTCCGNCGRLMIGSSQPRQSGISQRQYRCRRRDQYGNLVGCGNCRLADPTEDLVVEAVLERLNAPEVAQALTVQRDDSGVSSAVEEVAARRQYRRKLVAEYGRGEHSKEDYKIMLAAADEALEAAEAKRDKYLSSQTVAQLPTDKALREVWDDASNDWRAEIIKIVVEKVIILPGRPGSMRYKEWRFNPAHIQIVWKPLDKEANLSVAALITMQLRVSLALSRAKVS
jgi:DNA invertase Pin-like site-specific DNA recombinase